MSDERIAFDKPTANRALMQAITERCLAERGDEYDSLIMTRCVVLTEGMVEGEIHTFRLTFDACGDGIPTWQQIGLLRANLVCVEHDFSHADDDD